MKRFLKPRRPLFITVMSILLLAALLLPTFIYATPAFADTPTQHWDNKVKIPSGTTPNPTTTYTSSSLCSFGAVWIPGRSVWEYTFRLAGTAATRCSTCPPQSNKLYAVKGTTISIKKNLNPNAMAFWTSTDPRYIGSAPESSFPHANYGPWATAAVGYAVDAIKSTGLSFLWTTAQLIAALCSGSDTATTDPTQLTRQWYWSPGVTDAASFFWFLVDVNPNSQASFKVTYTVSTSASYGSVPLGPYTYTLTTPGPKTSSLAMSNSASSSTKGWNPGMMTAAEKKTYGIEEIPVSQLSKRASELNIAPETIKAAQDSGETVIYVAHNLQVTQAK